MFGFFFGPRFLDAKLVMSTKNRTPDEAIWLARFGDSGLMTGAWPILSTDDKWRKDKWPFPPFAIYDPISNEVLGKAYCSELDLMTHTRTEKCSPEEAQRLPADSVFDEGYVEQTMSELFTPNLARTSRPKSEAERRSTRTQDVGISGAQHFLYFPTRLSMAQAAKELEKLGFRTRTRESADGRSWLLLVTNVRNASSSLDAEQQALEALTSKLGGEYDGHERGPDL